MVRCCVMSVFAVLAFSASAQDAFIYKTEKLADNIWRVRARRDGKWPESGLGRYGILPKLPVLETSTSLDFGPVSVKIAHKGKGFEIVFPLADGERVYGLGDVSRENVQRRPGVYQMYVQNITTYIPIPMAWTTRGWGVFMNSTWRHFNDFGERR